MFDKLHELLFEPRELNISKSDEWAVLRKLEEIINDNISIRIENDDILIKIAGSKPGREYILSECFEDPREYSSIVAKFRRYYQDLKMWVETDYDLKQRYLVRNVSFPLLEGLIKVNDDKKAYKVLLDYAREEYNRTGTGDLNLLSRDLFEDLINEVWNDDDW